VTVELKPETEQLVQEEIRSGHIHSVDELIVYGVRALREKRHVQTTAAAPPRKPRKNLADFLMESPFAGSEIDLERQQDYGRPVEL
jgi:Arc/MetJ-type ribon-helix-helix transcriptional regulator